MAEPSVSLADRVADALRSAILAHDFEPGQRLSAAALAERFQVSQTPLREAFARLAGEGWVSYLPQRGIRVTEISVKSMVEIYELRELLEPMALIRSMSNGDDTWRTAVKEAYDTMVKLGGSEPADLAGPDYDRYEAAHVQFHHVLLRECDSQWLIRFTDMLSDHSRRYRRLSLPLRKRFGAVNKEHRRIYRAATTGDSEAAGAAIVTHISNTKLAIMDWLADAAEEGPPPR